jgi:hypothetical protein
MGPASAYNAVLSSIHGDVRALLLAHPEMFTFQDLDDGFVDIRDFQTTGVVAYARGCPFYELTAGRLEVMGQRVQVKEEYRQNCIASIQELVAKL